MMLSVLLVVGAAGVYWVLQARPVRAGYTYYRTITIDHTKIPNSDQPNFTVLICANGSGACNTAVSGLNQTGGGAHVQNSNGYDIIFTTDSACSSFMNWEVEKYIASTGELEAWVLIANLSHTSDTTFYMCYGNSAISTFQGGSQGSAWNSNYKVVYHMDEAANSTRNDSTGNADNAADTNSNVGQATGQISNGAAFTGATNKFLSPSTAIALTPPLEFDAWVKFSSFANYQAMFGNAFTSGKYTRSWFTATAFTMYDDSNGANGSAAISISTGTWYRVSISIDSGGSSYISINGSAPTQFATMNIWNGKTLTFKILGNFGGGSVAGLNGTMDEVRISNTNRSGDWIAAEYNNQSSPSTFETFGAEGSLGGGGGSNQVSPGVTVENSKWQIKNTKVKIQPR